MLYEIQPTGPARRLATQKVGYDQQGKSTATAQIAATLSIISQMEPREFNVVLRTTSDEFNVLPRASYLSVYHVNDRINRATLVLHMRDDIHCYCIPWPNFRI